MDTPTNIPSNRSMAQRNRREKERLLKMTAPTTSTSSNKTSGGCQPYVSPSNPLTEKQHTHNGALNHASLSTATEQHSSLLLPMPAPSTAVGHRISHEKSTLGGNSM